MTWVDGFGHHENTGHGRRGKERGTSKEKEEEPLTCFTPLPKTLLAVFFFF